MIRIAHSLGTYVYPNRASVEFNTAHVTRTQRNIFGKVSYGDPADVTTINLKGKLLHTANTLPQTAMRAKIQEFLEAHRGKDPLRNRKDPAFNTLTLWGPDGTVEKIQVTISSTVIDPKPGFTVAEFTVGLETAFEPVSYQEAVTSVALTSAGANNAIAYTGTAHTWPYLNFTVGGSYGPGKRVFIVNDTTGRTIQMEPPAAGVVEIYTDRVFMGVPTTAVLLNGGDAYAYMREGILALEPGVNNIRVFAVGGLTVSGVTLEYYKRFSL